MVQINFARKEINCKLVYYGPGLSGKTTNLEMVHQRTPEQNKGELTSISTDGDRTLFFDFMPLDLGEIAGMKTKFHLYTVPGQVYYNSTRKLVLLGADGIIFVADSSRAKLAENLESLDNLRENLAEMGKDLSKFPLVLQWNKRDVADAMPVTELNERLNAFEAPSFEAVASRGEGVIQTLKELSARVLARISSTEQAGLAAPPVEERPAAVEPVEKPHAREAAVQAQVAPPPVGGFQIERNEVQSEPRRREPEPRTLPLPAQSRVASNPLEEMGVAACAGPSAAAASGQASLVAAPAQVATLERPRAAQARPAARAEARAPAHCHGVPPPAESYRREVRVISGRRHGAPMRTDSDRSLVVGLIFGVAVAAAAVFAYTRFFG